MNIIPLCHEPTLTDIRKAADARRQEREAIMMESIGMGQATAKGWQLPDVSPPEIQHAARRFASEWAAAVEQEMKEQKELGI